MILHNPKLKMSHLLMTLLASVISSHACADSVKEWSYWDANPPLDPTQFQFEFNNQNAFVNAEQQRIGTNQGELVQATNPVTNQNPEWIGYLYAFTAINVAVSRNRTAALTLSPNAASQSVTVNVTDDPSISYSVNNAEFVDSENGRFSLRSSESSINIGLNTLTPQSSGTSVASLNNEPNGKFIATITNFSYSNNNDPRKGLFGVGYIGYLMTSSDINQLLAGQQSYGMIGRTAGGGFVSMNVNFASASWRGNWSDNSARGYKAFSASGIIDGTTLNSNVVNSLDTTDQSRDVIGGNVTAQLIGEAANSNFGVIGKVDLMVNDQSLSSVNTVSDAFFARTVGQDF